MNSTSRGLFHPRRFFLLVKESIDSERKKDKEKKDQHPNMGRSTKVSSEELESWLVVWRSASW